MDEKYAAIEAYLLMRLDPRFKFHWYHLRETHDELRLKIESK